VRLLRLSPIFLIHLSQFHLLYYVLP